jgi:hypothetical protein
MEDDLEQYALKIKLKQNYAQILIRVGSNLALKKAEEIIGVLGVRIIKSELLSSNVVLLKLGTKDMRNIVLKLTENGFLEIKGFNASSCKI